MWHQALCHFFQGQTHSADVFVNSVNDFSLNLFSTVSKMKANANVVLSPFSLSMAMGMLQQGTLGQTEKDIGSTLFNGLSKENVAKKFMQLKQVYINTKLFD